MNTDGFEQRLQRQPPRQIPADWREDILRAAQDAAVSDYASRSPHDSLLSTINCQLSTLLWPCPKAWAGLAAVWVLILAVNFSLRDKAPAVTEESPPSQETILVLQQQRRLLTELLGSSLSSEAERPEVFSPGPRSERREELLLA